MTTSVTLDRKLKDGNTDGKNGWQAHPTGTMINLFSGGYKKVEDLEIGDTLISDSGKPVKVVEKWPDELPIYEIMTTQGRFYYTPEHPVLIKHPLYSQTQMYRREFDEDSYSMRYAKVEDIKIGDRLVPNYITETTPQTGLTDPELQCLGFWLGDGYVDYSDRYTVRYCVVVNDEKKAYLDDIIGGRITWLRHSNGKAWCGHIRLGEGVSDNSNSKKYSKLHEYLKMCGRYSYGKEVPFNLSIHERLQVLKGYLKSDGTVKDTGTEVIYTTSRSLALWVQETAWSLGRNSSIAMTSVARTATNLGLRSHDLLAVSIGTTGRRHRGNSFAVNGIKYVGIGKCWHIEVDGNHTYVAENIKVHNCSRYSAYLATGKKTVYSKAHPDYGPVNGSAMVNYLIKTYGWEKCKKEDGAIFSMPVRSGMPYGHTGMVVDAKKNQVNDANWTKPLTVGTHVVNLEAYGATYCRPKAAKSATKTTTTPAKSAIKVGDTVIVNGAGTGNAQGGGGKTKSFKNQKMKVIVVSNGRYGCNQYNKKGAVTGFWTSKQVKK